jgi:cobalt-zinc-cadmium resistance protein CzcA
MITLSQIATINYAEAPAQISHEASKRRTIIGFNVHNQDIGSVISQVKIALKSLNLPVGYYIEFAGTFEHLEKAMQRLAIAVPISLSLILILLYLSFRSVKQTLVIFTAIPMSLIGGVCALWLRDMPFSIAAGIGFIALFGVVVLNGIVLIGAFNELKNEKIQEHHIQNQATPPLSFFELQQIIVQGCIQRLRPVLMTASVACLGFLPMAISSSAGAEVQKPLATVVIGGLFTATILTLFVIPILYHRIEAHHKR